MKKTLFAFIVFLAVHSVGMSQIFVSGDLGFVHTDENISDQSYKENDLSIHPIIGGFVANRLAVGAEFSLGFTHSQEENGELGSGNFVYEDINSKQHFIGVFSRFYTPISDKVRFIFHFGNGIIDGKMEYVTTFEEYSGLDLGIYAYSYKTEGELSGYAAYVKPGLSLNITDHWDIEFFLSNLSYNHLKYKYDTPVSYSSEQYEEEYKEFDFSFNELSLGATFTF